VCDLRINVKGMLSLSIMGLFMTIVCNVCSVTTWLKYVAYFLLLNFTVNHATVLSGVLRKA